MNELPDASVYRLRMKFGIGLLDHFVELRPLYALRSRLKQIKNLEVYFSGYGVRVDGHRAKLGSMNLTLLKFKNRTSTVRPSN